MKYSRLGSNKSVKRIVKPTRHRTALLPGVTVDLEAMRVQIISERGGPLLKLLQETASKTLDEVPSRSYALDFLAMSQQNLLGGRRRDVPVTSTEVRELMFRSLGLTLDFDREPVAHLRALLTHPSGRAYLAPASKEEALVLTEAYQAIGDLEMAQVTLSDGFGRYDDDGDREMMCLQANNAYLAERAGALSKEDAREIRSANIAEIFGKLARPRFHDDIGIDAISAVARETVRRTNPLVSIILTVYNAETTLCYALDSILNQTWRNIEVIAVDDCGTDGSLEILNRAADKDHRIKVVKAEVNIGAYAARNLALTHATGDVVTCHDADDWSHPSKIERQIRHLYAHKFAVASTSSWVRTTDELFFTRKSRHQRYIQKNPSSLMFRRTAIGRAGNWDEVSIGADTEFEERLKLVYGSQNVKHLNEVLSFGLDHSTSLSKEAVWRGWLSSDLDTYHRAFQHWHASIKARSTPETRIKIRRKRHERDFPAPARIIRQARPQRFDVVMMSDFRLYGGSTLSLVEEIEAQHRAGLTTAIQQINCVTEDIIGRRNLNAKIDQLLHAGKCTLIHDDWEIEAGCCSMRFPPIFDFAPASVARVDTPHHVMAVNTAPIERDGTGRMYHVDGALKNMRATFGTAGVWYPIGPRIREYIADEVPADVLSTVDWVNIIDVDAWIVKRDDIRSDRPRVGRHSRDDRVKWPNDGETIRQIYLADPNWDVRIMGGATYAETLAGPMPSNVRVLRFDAVPVRKFLESVDFYVYFDDPMRVEAFGRVFIEAIAAGCMVILPHYYRSVFGDACIYAEPSEVQDIVNRYWTDKDAFLAFTHNAQEIASRTWSYQTHIDRIRKLIESRG